MANGLNSYRWELGTSQRNQITCVVVKTECMSGPKEWVGDPQGVSHKTAPISGGGRTYGTRSLARLKGGAEGVDRRTARSDVGSTHNTKVSSGGLAGVGGWE
jgi:hypothetical protein